MPLDVNDVIWNFVYYKTEIGLGTTEYKVKAIVGQSIVGGARLII